MSDNSQYGVQVQIYLQGTKAACMHVFVTVAHGSACSMWFIDLVVQLVATMSRPRPDFRVALVSEYHLVSGFCGNPA